MKTLDRVVVPAFIAGAIIYFGAHLAVSATDALSILAISCATIALAFATVVLIRGE
jgi:hypothetical protein